MIVIAKKVGRLANRMLLFAHFIAAAREHGLTLANPAFSNYGRYFPATARDFLCRYPRRPGLPAPWVARELLYRLTLLVADALAARQRRGREAPLVRLRRDQRLDLDGPEFLARARRHRVLFVQDWFFRSADGCRKHRAAIREFFTPHARHRERSRELVEAARRSGRFLVGVHVRQGDYASFKEGRYFYSHREYRAVMERVRAAFADRDVAFLVCSDAPIPADAFAGLAVHYGNGHELEDLGALAGCDRLVGPPSTYGKWASFDGDVPRYELIDPAADVGPDAFRVDARL